MTDFIEGENRFQATLFPEQLDDYIAEDNSVRLIKIKTLNGTAVIKHIKLKH